MGLTDTDCPGPWRSGVWWRDNSKWQSYGPALSHAILQGLASGLAAIPLGVIKSKKHPQGAVYIADLRSMQQTNTSTGFTRKLKIVGIQSFSTCISDVKTLHNQMLSRLLTCFTRASFLNGVLIKMSSSWTQTRFSNATPNEIISPYSDLFKNFLACAGKHFTTLEKIVSLLVDAEQNRFESSRPLQLVFHGTRQANIPSILTSGLHCCSSRRAFMAVNPVKSLEYARDDVFNDTHHPQFTRKSRIVVCLLMTGSSHVSVHIKGGHKYYSIADCRLHMPVAEMCVIH